MFFWFPHVRTVRFSACSELQHHLCSFEWVCIAGTRILLRDTSIMPDIPGLPALVTMLFTPIMELRSVRHTDLPLHTSKAAWWKPFIIFFTVSLQHKRREDLLHWRPLWLRLEQSNTGGRLTWARHRTRFWRQIWCWRHHWGNREADVLRQTVVMK